MSLPRLTRYTKSDTVSYRSLVGFRTHASAEGSPVKDPISENVQRSYGRRPFMYRLSSFAAVTITYLFSRRSSAATSGGQKKSNVTRGNGRLHMRAASEMRQQALQAGDQGYGAVIVKGAEIVGRGPSRVVTNGDPTAHAEMEAIRDACERLGTTDLSGCTMYGTSPPCAMCETAAYWARLDEVRFGADGNEGHAPRYGGC